MWVDVGIHRLDSASSAMNALEYSLNDQVVSTRPWEDSVTPIAANTRVLVLLANVRRLIETVTPAWGSV